MEYMMLTVKFLRKIGVLEEEYGKIRFDGKKIHYDGLSSIFIKYLERGIKGADHKYYRPEHGIQFLQNLKNQFLDDTLVVTDIQTG
jgi:hypothetical protein